MQYPMLKKADCKQPLLPMSARRFEFWNRGRRLPWRSLLLTVVMALLFPTGGCLFDPYIFPAGGGFFDHYTNLTHEAPYSSLIDKQYVLRQDCYLYSYRDAPRRVLVARSLSSLPSEV